MFPRQNKLKEDQMMSSTEYLSSKHRMVTLRGIITGEVEFSNFLLALSSSSSEPIKILIASPGGLVDGALMLYDTIKAVDVPVLTLGRFCYSAAVLLLAAGTRRYVMPHTRIMLHLPYAELQGDTAEIAILQRELAKGRDVMVGILQECGVKRTRKQILKDIDRAFFMSAQEAIDYGLADEIMTKDKLKEWMKEE